MTFASMCCRCKLNAESRCVFSADPRRTRVGYSGTHVGRGSSALAFQADCVNRHLETGRKSGFSVNPIMGQANACLAKAPLK